MLAVTRLLDVFTVHACAGEAAGMAGHIRQQSRPRLGAP
jgi:hypothetical protein